MPVGTCSENGKPGYRWGTSGKCYTYSSGDEIGRKKAKQKAYLQGAAATGGTMKEWIKNESFYFNGDGNQDIIKH